MCIMWVLTDLWPRLHVAPLPQSQRGGAVISYLSHDVSLTAGVAVLLQAARVGRGSSAVRRLAGRVAEGQAALEVHRQLGQALWEGGNKTERAIRHNKITRVWCYLAVGLWNRTISVLLDLSSSIVFSVRRDISCYSASALCFSIRQIEAEKSMKAAQRDGKWEHAMRKRQKQKQKHGSGLKKVKKWQNMTLKIVKNVEKSCSKNAQSMFILWIWITKIICIRMWDSGHVTQV